MEPTEGPPGQELTQVRSTVLVGDRCVTVPGSLPEPLDGTQFTRASLADAVLPCEREMGDRCFGTSAKWLQMRGMVKGKHMPRGWRQTWFHRLRGESVSWSFDPHNTSPPRHLVTGTLEAENPAVSQPLLGNSYPAEVSTLRLHKSVVEKSL